MRAFLFQKLLAFLNRHPSRLIANIELEILMLATERAFERKGKFILFSSTALKDYALFTRSCAAKPCKPIRLYRTFKRLGKSIRLITGFQDPKDLSSLIFYFYKNIGITMDGSLPGEVTVHRCFFSRYYDPGCCRLISLMDEGLILGICGDGDFAFTKRITEGSKVCKACLHRKETI